MSEFVRKDNKWLRNNSDGTQTQVYYKDGYFYWRQSDGKLVRSNKKYNVTTKSKQKSTIQKIGDFLTNTSIQASVVDNPSVMIASGYERNKDGSWNVNPTSKGASQLRKDLTNLGIGSTIAVIPGAIPTMIVGAGTEAVEREFTGKSLGDVVSNFVKENNPISNNGYFGTLGNYIWDKGSELVRPEYSLYPTIKWGTTPKLIGNGAEFDVYSAPFWRYVKKVGDVSPEEVALKGNIPETISMKFKGQNKNGQYEYTQKKAFIPKVMPKLHERMKLYNKIMENKEYLPGNYDRQTQMLDFISKDGQTVVTDLGQGNIGYRNVFDYLFKRQPVIIDNSVLPVDDYLALFKKGGKLCHRNR